MNLDDYTFSKQHYDWSVNAFSFAKKWLKLNIKLHDNQHLSAQGQIFLFNHFSRFETFIPQYLIYQKTHQYCRSIASAEFFNDDIFADYLKSVGVVPSNLEDLFPFLLTELFHGKKLILFPEGGMVKDKRVIDSRGEFNIYSRMALERRKQHRGAAVLGLAMSALKVALLHFEEHDDIAQLEFWAEQLKFDSTEQMLQQAAQPSYIIPSHITFYPIRFDSNFLSQTVHALKNNLSPRFSEELIIESNLLFKRTDMDVHFGQVVDPYQSLSFLGKKLIPSLFKTYQSIDDLFKPFNLCTNKVHQMAAKRLETLSYKVRDKYMCSMYQAVSIHLSHVSSRLIMLLYQRGLRKIKVTDFHTTLYLCIKHIQKLDTYNLHRSLKNPDNYDLLLDGGNGRLRQFFRSVKKSQLVYIEKGYYVLNHKLIEQFDFDSVRVNNIISVYNNEIAPLHSITDIINSIIEDKQSNNNAKLLALRFDDQLRSFQWDLELYSKPRYSEINIQRTASADANSFLMQQKQQAATVLLIHGFLASPAEMKPLALKLYEHGYHVIAVRLKGHGTSPWDLKNTTWQQWKKSVLQGFQIAKLLSQKIHVVGFSTGGLLALLLAKKHAKSMQSLSCISAPIYFHNSKLKYIPIVHKANKLAQWVGHQGILPFIENQSEHPDINYKHIPVRALYQLQLLIKQFNSTLKIDCPSLLMHADEDPVIDVKSMDYLSDLIVAPSKKTQHVHAKRHGIVYENLDSTQQKIMDWIKNCE